MGITSERKFEEKKYSIFEEDLFCFSWSSPEFGKKKCSIFDEDLFLFLFFGLHLNSARKSVLFLTKTFFLIFIFWSSPELGEKKCSICIFSLVFTKFPHLSKIVVEVHPPMLKIGQNWGKIANYPPPMLNKDRHHWLESWSALNSKIVHLRPGRRNLGAKERLFEFANFVCKLPCQL